MLTSLLWVCTKTENCHKYTEYMNPVENPGEPTPANQKVRRRQSQAEWKPDPQASALERMDSHVCKPMQRA